MRKIIFATVLVAASVSAANAARIPCPNCTETGYRNKAVWAGVGRHYIYDLPRGQLRRYYVECMGGGMQAMRAESGESAQLSSDMVINELLEDQLAREAAAELQATSSSSRSPAIGTARR